MGILSGLKRLLRSSDRREHARHAADTLHLVIDGKAYRSIDWSLGGVRVDGLPNQPTRGDRLEGEVRYGSARGKFVAEVVNELESGQHGLRFIEIAPGVFIAMSGMARR